MFVVAAMTGAIFWRAGLPSQRPNVLLITLDTTRADRLACHGYAPALTPALDSLAAKGVLFERAITPAPLTLPSHASLMTGLYPSEHGLITNGRGRLEESIPTLAEMLQAGGYDTAAFVGSLVLDSKFGLDRGFAVYDDDMTNSDATEHGLDRQRDGRRVVDSALGWLMQRRTKPFFCWVHLYDAHQPYQAHPEEFGDRFRDRQYDGEIAYVDRQIERLLKHLHEHGLSEKTMVVAVGDHGESLGEHDELEHSLTLYDSVLNVPWIWAGPGAAPAGRRVAQPVSLVGLRPTLLEMVGLRELGASKGRSLRGVVSGGEIAAGNCCSATDDPLLEHGWSPLRSLTTAAWKYIRSPEAELYDLTRDPHETQNLAAALPDQVRELDFQLTVLEGAMTRRQAEAVELSPKERRALASLGYLGGQNLREQPTDSSQPLPDVKRMLPIYNKAEVAHRLVLEGNATDAEKRLRDLIRKEPDYLPARLFLAAALTQQSKFGESRELLEQALKDDPDNSEAHFQLGSVYLAQQQFAAAVAEFRRSLASKPNAVGVLFNMGQALMQLGDSQAAEDAFREVLELDPLYANAHLYLGALLAGQRRQAEAERHFREALECNPRSAEAHGNLAVLLSDQQRFVEAGEHFVRAVELAPQNAGAHFNYGAFLLSQRRLDDAAARFEEALRLNPQHAQARIRLEQVRDMQNQPQ